MTPASNSSTPTTRGPILSIAMQRDLLLDEWFVTRVDLEVGVIKNQTRFSPPVPLHSALAEQMVRMIAHLLPTQPQSSVYVDDNAEFSLPDLNLRGIRVVAQKVFDGTQTIVIRFRQVFGAVQTLYAPEMRLSRLTRPQIAP